jgi:HD superfamily phosphohydrolase YqeK
MQRVAELMAAWSRELELPADEQIRWRAAAMLHDSLRDARAEHLRALVDEPFRSLPDAFLHGPAAAAMLERDGVTAADMLDAIRYHTLGHAAPGRLGRALVSADFLEAGRPELPVWRSSLRARMPAALDDVFIEVVKMRLRVSVEEGKPLRPEFIAMYNRLVTGERPV